MLLIPDDRVEEYKIQLYWHVVAFHDSGTENG